MRRKILVIGTPPAGFEKLARSCGLDVVDREPDVIVAYGGDGTLMGAERDFPGVPKVGLRRDDSCVKCGRHRDDVVLTRIARGEYDEERLMKIEGVCRDVRLTAINDVIFRNADPRSAVRFVLSLNDAPVTEELIGDGLVVATPFGSSAYFRSITRMTIRAGIGVAFNNCTDFLAHLVIKESETLAVDLMRGPATLTCDNDPQQYPIDAGDRLLLRRAPGDARLVCPDTLRCHDCRYKHAPRRRY
jgi:NAD+ kinase